jgi:histidine triad (HIT) family protein
MDDCLFCKIINGQIPADMVYENDKIFVFKDIKPEAPIHVLIVPKLHIGSIQDLNDDNSEYLVAIHHAANKVAKQLGIYDKGYRLINNCGKDAGQSVMHLHYHLLGGKFLGAKIL